MRDDCLKTYKLTVFGRVQRVGYRRYVVQVATSLGYDGYVKKLNNGIVEVVINASSEMDLEFFITKLYEGSFLSSVKDVRCVEIEFVEYDTFVKR